MEESTVVNEGLPRQGHRLLQVGFLLFLLALFVGLGVPSFSVPRLALSTHLLGIMQGTFLVAAGLIWPRLRLSASLSRIACGLAIYGCVAAWTANLSAAVLGAGSSMMPIAAGTARGSPLQEAAILIALRSAAVSLIAAVVMVLWGLRAFGAPKATRTAGPLK